MLPGISPHSPKASAGGTWKKEHNAPLFTLFLVLQTHKACGEGERFAPESTCSLLLADLNFILCFAGVSHHGGFRFVVPLTCGLQMRMHGWLVIFLSTPFPEKLPSVHIQLVTLQQTR